MSTGTAGKPLRELLDTNILISALVYGGKPEQIVRLILEKKAKGITSLTLLVELLDTLIQKFHFELPKIQQIEELMKKNFLFVYSRKTLHIVKDEDDNRVLEAALEGNCNYIVTGDKELLDLRSFRGIKIITADQLLREIGR